MRNRTLASAVVVSSLVGLVAASAPAANASVARRSEASPSYYVSLGDSYAIGYQPNRAVSKRFGYASVVTAAERRRGHRLTLVNFGCGGATVGSVLTTPGCPQPALGGVSYPSVPQARAATRFIAAHRGHIALITISIGGNNLANCGAARDPLTCITAAIPSVARGITTLCRSVHAAAGGGVPIVGLTYPNVLLGAWVHHPTSKSMAALSVAAFKLVVNPVLERAYDDNGATFVDVTAASGAYTPLYRTTTLQPFGRIPVAVADVCTYTWYCASGNIHPRTSGYRLIAKLILAALPGQLR